MISSMKFLSAIFLLISLGESDPFTCSKSTIKTLDKVWCELHSKLTMRTPERVQS